MRQKFSLVEFSVNHPKLILFLSAAVTIAFLTQFAKIRTDTNPKNMLPANSDVRVWNDEVEKTFGLYEDTLVVGIVNEGGILNKGTLGKIARITGETLKINGVAARDVTGFPTITNVTAEAGVLRVAPLMAEVPKNEEETASLRKNIFGNPLFIDRIISKDAKTAAIYIPLEKGANGKAVADRLREVAAREGGPEKYYIAGDPVARDTFGSEMFKLMGVFSPISGLVMFAAALIMFRSFLFPVFIMMPAMMIIIWSMGLLIGMGFPIHIMSSMSPVFLMAIATDSIHIFNEFYFRCREKKGLNPLKGLSPFEEKKAAIIETMKAVGTPLIYTDITTAVGFASLLLANIIPLKVFGFGVAFGTLALLLSSFTLVPALLALIDIEKLKLTYEQEDIKVSKTSFFLQKLGGLGTGRPKTIVIIGLILCIAAVIGMTRIVVNNNMLKWFKYDSSVRAADRALNSGLGGTSVAYIIAISNTPTLPSPVKGEEKRKGSSEDDYIKSPEAMRYIEGLQRYLERIPAVGKTSSVVDYVKRINLALHDNDPEYDSVPDTKEMIGQYLFLLGMSTKPSDLDNVVDYPFRKANIQVQLKTWDAQAMKDVIKAIDTYKNSNPGRLELKPAGTAYFNLVWNDEVLWDMLKGFIAALVAVFLILILNFRSVKWAAIAYIPLLFTIILIYGVVGFAGKDFDMPISVLSCLSLGMAVDFSIHFISRFKQRLKEIAQGVEPPEGAQPLQSAASPDTALLTEALLWTAVRPGKGILRNALLFALAFSVMLFAPLTPYITVGAFIVSMMILSVLFTIIYLPALIILTRGWLFKKEVF